MNDDELLLIDAYWRAANYLSVGQIYLLDNPLLREPLRPEHVKPRLLGHWGTTPGLNFVYVHLNRVIRQRDLNMIYVTGPGHGGPAAGRQHLPRRHLQRGLPAHRPGRRRACSGCSGSSPSPAASPATSRPRRPGSIHEGGELGYSPAHAYGAVVRQPRPDRRLRRRRRRGRDRAARGELALQQVPQPAPRRRRAADPAPQRLQDRQPDRARPHPRERAACAAAAATATSRLRRGRRPDDDAPADGRRARRGARRDRRDPARRPRATAMHRAPALADDRPAHAEGLDRPEGGRRPAGRGHLPRPPGAARRGRARNPSTCAQLEEWMRSYRPEELFDDDGAPRARARRRWRRRASGG